MNSSLQQEQESSLKVSNVKGNFKYHKYDIPDIPSDLSKRVTVYKNFWSVRVTASEVFEDRRPSLKIIFCRKKPNPIEEKAKLMKLLNQSYMCGKQRRRRRQFRNSWSARFKDALGIKDIVFTIFPSSSHVNVSGLPDFSYCDKAAEGFARLFKVRKVGGFCVDNSTASGCIDAERLSLLKLSHIAKSAFDRQKNLFPLFPCTVSVKPHLFPSATIRPANADAKKKIGTSIVFSNGKIIIVGAKSMKEISNTFHNLKPVLYQAIAFTKPPPTLSPTFQQVLISAAASKSTAAAAAAAALISSLDTNT